MDKDMQVSWNCGFGLRSWQSPIGLNSVNYFMCNLRTLAQALNRLSETKSRHADLSPRTGSSQH